MKTARTRVRCHRRGEGALDLRGKAPALEQLAAKGLDHPHAGDALFEHGGGIGQAILHLGGEPFEPPAKEEADPDQRRDQHQDEEGELPVEHDHQRQPAHKGDGDAQERGGRVGERSLHHRHVVGDARDQFADAVVVVEAQRQVEQALLRRQPQIRHDALADKGEQVDLGQIEQALQHEEAQQRDGDLRQQLLVAGAEDRVDEQADRPRQRQHHQAAHQQRGGGHDHRQPVGAQVAEQPAQVSHGGYLFFRFFRLARTWGLLVACDLADRLARRGSMTALYMA
jgi:hypothetical protein